MIFRWLKLAPKIPNGWPQKWPAPARSDPPKIDRPRNLAAKIDRPSTRPTPDRLNSAKTNKLKHPPPDAPYAAQPRRCPHDQASVAGEGVLYHY